LYSVQCGSRYYVSSRRAKNGPSQMRRPGHSSAAGSYSVLAVLAADHIPYCCSGLEVSAGSCSGLHVPPRSLLFHHGHQRSQFPRSTERGLVFVPFARRPTCTSTSSVWNGSPLAQQLLLRVLSDTFCSSTKTVLFSRVKVGSASE